MRSAFAAVSAELTVVNCNYSYLSSKQLWLVLVSSKLSPEFHSNARNARKVLRNKKYPSKIKNAQ